MIFLKNFQSPYANTKMWKFFLLLIFFIFIAVLYWTYKNNLYSFIKSRINTVDPIQRIEANDFLINLSAIKTNRIPTSKTASIFLNTEFGDRVNVVEQRYDFQKIWDENNLDHYISQVEPFLDFNGGIKQHFIFEENNFILATLKNKSSDHCYFASLINLTNRSEIFRTPCLSKESIFDFNGIGGGYAIRGEKLYLAIGAPEYTSSSVRKLAQDPKSPYGKVLVFNRQRLLSKPSNIFTFDLYTIGHRNPQGMVNIEGELFEIEHGPKGGDEINLITKSGNYGWPIYSLGSPYPSESVEPYRVVSKDSQFKSPMFAFIPSIGSSDIRACPAVIANRYKPLGCLLVSSLRAQSLFIVLFERKTHTVASAERLGVGMRIREFARNSGDRVIFSVDDAAKDTSGIYELKITRTLP